MKKNRNLVCMTALGYPEKIRYAEYALLTWRWWCREMDVDLMVLDGDNNSESMKPTWYRYSLFDHLERMGNEYDQIALVDADTMVRWDCPDFFLMSQRRLAAVCDSRFPGWVVQSIRGYAPFFPGTDLDVNEYINAGFMVVNNNHRPLFNAMLEFHRTHWQELRQLEDIRVRRGTDQTPLNYLIKQKSIAVEYLPDRYNLLHFVPFIYDNRLMIRRFSLGFINRAYVWHFNGIKKGLNRLLMERTWLSVKEHYRRNDGEEGD